MAASLLGVGMLLSGVAIAFVHAAESGGLGLAFDLGGANDVFKTAT